MPFSHIQGGMQLCSLGIAHMLLFFWFCKYCKACYTSSCLSNRDPNLISSCSRCGPKWIQIWQVRQHRIDVEWSWNHNTSQCCQLEALNIFWLNYFICRPYWLMRNGGRKDSDIRRMIGSCRVRFVSWLRLVEHIVGTWHICPMIQNSSKCHKSSSRTTAWHLGHSTSCALKCCICCI